MSEGAEGLRSVSGKSEQILILGIRTTGSPVCLWEARIEGVPAHSSNDTDEVGDERHPPDHLLPWLLVNVL